jgi:hypothetical protein
MGEMCGGTNQILPVKTHSVVVSSVRLGEGLVWGTIKITPLVRAYFLFLQKLEFL